ncbi:MAG TPA: membrane dipeptidase [Steroidobacter sp.]
MTFGKRDSVRVDRRSFLAGSLALAAGGVAAAPGADGSKPVARTERLVINGLDTSDINDEFLNLLREGGVHCSHVSLGDAYSYGSVLRFVDERPDKVTIAKTAAQILAAKQAGRVAFVFGSQAASEYLPPLLNQGPRQTYETIRTALRVHHELGMRTQGIAYNLANVFGGGCLEPKSPLTQAGRHLVEAVHEQRILLDVGGHTGEQTSFDALAISSGVPVVCTHTNVAALNPNPRATSDRLFEAIAKTGGMVGVTAISDFHMRSAASVTRKEPRSPQATLAAHLDQYDYLKRLIGVDHIGLGTDFIWGWGNSYVHSSADNMVFPAEAMSDGPSQVVNDFENISKLGNVERGLSQRGWSQAELDKLMGANWLRVYGRVWGA